MVKILLNILQPVVMLLAKFYVRFEKPEITGAHYYLWRNKIRKGDVLLSSSDASFGSNLINPSEIKHGAIYMGKNATGVCNVTEMIGKGCVLTDLVTFLTTKDRIIIVRPKFKFNVDKAIESAYSRLGKEYDYEFESGDDQYYCFEHIAISFMDASNDLSLIKSKTLGYEYYSSSTFLDVDKFEIIVDSDDKKIK